MNLEQTIMEKLKALPSDKQQQALDFIEFLEQKHGISRPRRSVLGIASDLRIDITEEDIAEARREMWGNFPRKDI